MISAVSILDLTGEVIILKTYRKDFNQSAFENYRLSVIATNEITSPTTLIDGNSFLCHMENSIYYVASTRQNSDASLIFEILTKMPEIFAKVLGEQEINDKNITQHVTDIIEILDEMIDSGYPQITEPETLKVLCQKSFSSSPGVVPAEIATQMATGPLPWRQPNIQYSKQKVYVDIIEKFSLVKNQDGTVSNKCVEGYTMMNVNLSANPICTFTFNAKETQGPNGEVHVTTGSIDIDDIIFHQCVRLDKLLSNKEISFIPPNGSFELMRYKKTDGISPPFEITPVVSSSGNKFDLLVKVQSTYDRTLKASPFTLTIPISQRTANVSFECSDKSKAKYDESNNTVVWTVPEFLGQTAAQVHIHAAILSSQYKISSLEKSLKPMSAEFHIPKLSPSGLSLASLVFGRDNPETYFRYTTENGHYYINIQKTQDGDL